MSRHSRYTWFVLILLFVGPMAIDSAVLTAQRRVPPSFIRDQAGAFGPLRWRNLGPLRGGRSVAVAGSAARPNEYYFGATGGGVWKSTDGGATWNPVTDGKIKTSAVGSMAVAPSNPDIVYVGMGEAELRGNIAQGDGVYKTTDGGKTWTHVGLEDTLAIGRVRVHPTNPDIVYVAALGHPAGPNTERGIFRSKDGGKSWQKILYRDDKTGGIEVSLDPKNPQVIFASLWEAFRVAHGMSSGGPASGLFKSTDGGDTWKEISRAPGMPKGILGKIGVDVSGADSNRVYALVEAEDGGMFVSDDAGATWKLVSGHRDLRQRAFYYTRVFADPKVKDTLWVPNVRFEKSTDGGKTWPEANRIWPPHGDNHDMWIDPTNPQRMIVSNDGGANVTLNGGQTFTDLDFPTAQFYHVITTGDVPYHVCGAQQDNTTACVSSRPELYSRVAPVFYSAGGGESGYIANDPKNPDIFYAGSYGGQLTQLNRKTKQLRRINVYPDNPMGYASKDIVERFQWTTPIMFSRVDPSALYVGSQHLFKSTNGGQTWTKISPDLTRHDPKTMEPSGGPITKDHTGVETYATIYTIAPSYKEENVIWTGSDDGYVHVTRNGGQNWKNVTPKDMPDFARISLIDASPFRAGTAYVAANRYQHDDFAPYVFRTDDYGETWTKIVNGIPPRHFARAVREDPKKEKLLYLGTEHGVFVSFDDGANWQSLQQNLPVTPVHDLVVENNDLVIGTHGRAFWVMDDIGPLREWGSQTAGLHVFKPRAGLRGLDRTLPIDYVLKQPAQKVTIEFLDASGKPIRTFVGTPENEAHPVEISDDEVGNPPDPRPPVSAGFHRVYWDMCYSRATEFPGMILWAAATRGPIGPPGSYQVRVTADGQSQTQAFAIGRETTLLADVTDADLKEEFDLAMQINQTASQANDAVLLVRGIKPQIKDRESKLDSKTGPTAKALQDLEKNLTAVEVELYQTKNEAYEDPLNFPIMLNNKLLSLQATVEGSDNKPTDQTHQVYKVLFGRTGEQFNKLDTTVKTQLPQVNLMLQRQKLAPIVPEPLKPEKGTKKPPSQQQQ